MKHLNLWIAPGLYALVVTFIILFGFSWWAYDDPFITFRYAENLRRGLGFVYNPGDRVLSTTTPFYAILLAALSTLWDDIPRLSNTLSAGSLALGSIALWVLARQWGQPTAGLIAMVLYPFFPLLIETLGSEMPFYIMSILWAFALQSNRKSTAAMLLAGVATITRPDGILPSVLLAVWLLRTRPKLRWLSLLAFGIPTIPWYLFAWIYFGSPLPVTLAAKQHQAEMAISQSFLQGFIVVITNYMSSPQYVIQTILFMIGLAIAIVRRQWLILFAWASLHFVGYTILGVPRYFWYYTPIVPAFVILTGLGASIVLNRCRKLIPHYTFILQPIVMCLLMWPQISGVARIYLNPDPRANIYRDVGLWLRETTAPSSTVGTLEVGIIGYYSRRPMVDFAGLVQPEVAKQMRRDTTYQDTALWAIVHYTPDYLVLNPDWFPEVMDRIVQQRCTELRWFRDDWYPGTLIVYWCAWNY